MVILIKRLERWNGSNLLILPLGDSLMSKEKYVLKTCLPLSIGQGKGAADD